MRIILFIVPPVIIGFISGMIAESLGYGLGEWQRWAILSMMMIPYIIGRTVEFFSPLRP